MKCTALALILALLLTLSGCGGGDLMADIKPSTHLPAAEITDDDTAAAADFGLRLFRQACQTGQNTLVSPLSVLCALGMTANGARENTLSQMEAALGMSLDTLNPYLRACLNSLPSEKPCRLHSANSIWFRKDDGFTVNSDFLQANADWYGADLYQKPFDNATLSEINRWVSKETDGMIPQILRNIPDDAVMYLINALAFDGEWQEVYQESQVREDLFTAEDGVSQTAEFMYATESQFLRDECAAGFLKPYAGGRYAFAALLPEEGVSLETYLSSLTGERLHTLLSNPETTEVRTSIPKFSADCGLELNDVLRAMGMSDAFDPDRANFFGIGHTADGSSLFISQVLHKTHIDINERGTKAGAATAVVMMEPTSDAPVKDPQTVYLNRPFVYMLIDCQQNLPIFLGMVTSLTA